MKRLLTAALAFSLLGGSIAVAQPSDTRRDDHAGAQNPAAVHHWAQGERMPNTYYQDKGHYVDYRTSHLRAPQDGYRWVRTEDNNYALVAITTGLIASIVANGR